MRIVNPTLNDTLDTLNATPEEKAVLVGFLENQVASAIGRVNGLTSSIADLTRQKDAAELEAVRITAMLDKFTTEYVEPVEPVDPEPAP